MSATIPMLLVSTVVTAFAPQRAPQEPSQPKTGSRRPVDVSVEGLVDATRRALDDAVRDGNIGFSARQPTESTLPFDCLESIADQAAGACLTASSTPTLGLLYPYPGLNNVFIPQAFVGGGENNQATGAWSAVGGGKGNTAAGDGATIGGGLLNRTLSPYATVGGGANNTASGRYTTVAGGLFNRASGSLFATVGGGFNNDAYGDVSTVGGGQFNVALGTLSTIGGGGTNSSFGLQATVGGGFNNNAYGNSATVPGGLTNNAFGNYSFAAGRRAKANHSGAFVWGDSFNGDKTSSAADQFNVYASGGVRMFTNSAATTGVLLAAGGSTWTMVSDRDAKENVEPVHARAVLDKVAALPLSTWNYKAQDDSIRHMGPMAQDFYAAFGLGLGDKTIDTIDPNGVALAAIQGLNEVVKEKDAEIADLRAANEALRQTDEELRARLERLEALAQVSMARGRTDGSD